MKPVPGDLSNHMEIRVIGASPVATGKTGMYETANIHGWDVLFFMYEFVARSCRGGA